MSEYSKKLHIKYNGVQTDIKLYTTTNDVGSNYLSINDGSIISYAKLDSSTGTNLHIKKNGTTYNIMKEIEVEVACPTGKFFTSEMLGGVHTSVFTIPAGVKIIKYFGSLRGASGDWRYASVTAGKSYAITTYYSIGEAYYIQVDGKYLPSGVISGGISPFYYSPEINTHTPEYSWDKLK